MKNAGKKSKKWVGWLVAVVLVIAVGAVVLNGGTQAATALSQEIATTGSITSYYSFTGNVKVENSQYLTAMTAATIREVYVEEGDQVAKGDRLMRTSDGETLKASVSGEVDRLYVEKDDEVSAGASLADIVDFGNLSIEIKVDEFDVPAVVIGKTAHVTVNALDVTFDTTVTRVEKQATQEGDISYYMATLALPTMEGVLPGMQVDVKIVNAQVEDVTVLSMEALQFTPSNEPYVMVQGSDGAQQTLVTLGVNDGVRVEIQSGVRSGETIILPAKAAGGGMAMFGGMGSQGEQMREGLGGGGNE